MPNSAGVVGPDYLIPVDLDFATATLEDVAQATVDLGLVNDTSGTFTPTVAGIVGPDFLAPIDADYTAVLAIATVLTALESAGVLTDTENPGTGGQNSAGVVGPDYLTPQPLAFSTATLTELLPALENAGLLNDTGA